MPNEKFLQTAVKRTLETSRLRVFLRPAFAPQDDGILGTAHCATLQNLPPRGLVPMSSVQVVQVSERENRQNLCNSYLTDSRLQVSPLNIPKRHLSLLADLGRRDLHNSVWLETGVCCVTCCV